MDGDIDVLSASFEDDKIAWYENTDGNGSFGPQKSFLLLLGILHQFMWKILMGMGIWMFFRAVLKK